MRILLGMQLIPLTYALSDGFLHLLPPQFLPPDEEEYMYMRTFLGVW